MSTRAAVAAVVFFDHAAAVGAGRLQRGVVARNGVAVVLFGFAHHVFGHGGNFLHKGFAAELAFFHLGQLVLPLAGECGFGEFFDPQAAQQRHQLKRFGGGHQLAPIAQHVFFGEQAFDNGRPRGWGAQAFFLHGFAQLVVVHQLACALHGAKQRRFAVAGGWAGFQGLEQGFERVHRFARLHGHQWLTLLGIFALFGFFAVVGLIGFFAVHRHPAGLDQHFALGLEVVRGTAALHFGDAGGDHEFGRRVEHRNKAAHHQVVELLLGLGQATGRLQRGDDGKVVAHLGVVKHLFGGLDVAVVERHQRVGRQVVHAAVGQHLHGGLDGGQVVLRQGA